MKIRRAGNMSLHNAEGDRWNRLAVAKPPANPRKPGWPGMSSEPTA